MKIQWAASESVRNDCFLIRKHVFIEEQQVPQDVEMDEHDVNALHAVCYIDNAPVGAVRLREKSPGVGKVERLCVLKSTRGTGAGRELMNAVTQMASLNGWHAIHLNAQAHAEDFYLKLGYQTVSEPFLEANIPHVKMERSL
ncbi:GNAT family N-acetyltransferase [Bacillaceae bacterium SIJ1]|uniref:GNAT family N-acetyltransferase n=1 Tax=Litoribacterium kuwaitense TaxID=1398745 RepID=UPI0013ED3692|nr:GNAT family N-acetyltransferase [Litoribacterium kuwaitense]NGP46153.1 GNAT family N-acetyltransferase [Litoribacterium kuwaitense]